MKKNSYDQFLRLKRNSSHQSHYIQDANRLTEAFEQREYSRELVLQARERIGMLPRNDLFKERQRIETSQFTFTLKYTVPLW